MHASLSIAFSSAYRLLVVLVVVVCIGCDGNDSGESRDAVVAPHSAGANDVEPGKVASERVPMSRDAFVYYVANETVGNPGDGFILFLKIPGKLTLTQRAERYTEPMAEAFEQAELGEVISAAAMMGAKPFAGISVEVSDLEKGVAVIIETLQLADAPEGTEIRYGEGDNKKFMRFESGS